MVAAVFAIIGLSSAAMDVGGNTLLVWSQPPERVGSSLNALHLCFGLARSATPLIVSRSLDWGGDLSMVGCGWWRSACWSFAALVRGATQPVRRAPTNNG